MDDRRLHRKARVLGINVGERSKVYPIAHFNIGVEVGQLSVITAAFVVAVLLRRYSRNRERPAAYRRFVVLPASGLIGIFGLWWTVERLIN